jgi:hypothetical protein
MNTWHQVDIAGETRAEILLFFLPGTAPVTGGV